MDIRDEKYQSHKTSRQWALQGYLPKPGTEGIRLWANAFHQKNYLYYAPEEVRKAGADEISSYFSDERERRNRLAKERRRKQKEESLRMREQNEKAQQEQMILDAVTPYQDTITELHVIIASLTEQLRRDSDQENCYVIDTETTGLDPTEDELLQCTILDTSGNIVYNSYFKPHATSWPEAEAVNHISPQMVADAPAISDEIDTISAILSSAKTIIGYNPYFDLDFFRYNGIIVARNTEVIDVMERFAPIYGEWDEVHESYYWKSLQTCANYYGYDWNGDTDQAHDSLADCRATLFCYQKMNEKEK
jgi:DNA polymerase-3 subunit epsilon